MTSLSSRRVRCFGPGNSRGVIVDRGAKSIGIFGNWNLWKLENWKLEIFMDTCDRLGRFQTGPLPHTFFEVWATVLVLGVAVALPPPQEGRSPVHPNGFGGFGKNNL